MTDQQPRFAPQSPRHKWDIENCPRPCSSSPVVVEEEERRHGEPHRAVLYGEGQITPSTPSPGSRPPLFSPLSNLVINIHEFAMPPADKNKHPVTVGTD